MRALLVNTSDFKTIISAISRVFPEFIFEFRESGIKISAITPNHLAVAEGFLHRDFFDNYESKENSRFSLNLDSETIRKVIPQLKNDPLVIYTVGTWLIFEVQDTPARSFAIHKKRLWEHPPKISKYNYEYRVEIDPDEFRQLVSDASVVSDELNIFCQSDKISFTSQGEFCEYSFGDKKERVTNPVATVMLNYLKKLVKLTHVAQTVIVSVGKSLPVRLEFDIGDSNISFLFSSKNP